MPDDRSRRRAVAGATSADVAGMGQKINKVILQSGTITGLKRTFHPDRTRPRTEDAEAGEASARRSPSVRKMSIYDVINQIGNGVYEHWKVGVYRTGPKEHNGRHVRLGKIWEFGETNTSQEELHDQIVQQFGGGHYAVRVHDGGGRVRKTTTFEVIALPPQLKEKDYLPPTALKPEERIAVAGIQSSIAKLHDQHWKAFAEAYDKKPSAMHLRRLVIVLLNELDTLGRQVRGLAAELKAVRDVLVRNKMSVR
jgi:hypothetical protein